MSFFFPDSVICLHKSINTYSAVYRNNMCCLFCGFQILNFFVPPFVICFSPFIFVRFPVLISFFSSRTVGPFVAHASPDTLVSLLLLLSFYLCYLFFFFQRIGWMNIFPRVSPRRRISSHTLIRAERRRLFFSYSIFFFLV